MSSSEDEGELDQIDLFYAQRKKSALATYGTNEELSSSDSEEEEVMPLDLSSSEADLSSTDQSGYERDPLSLKAWGRKVATYYEEGEGESLDSELEEREALQLQTLQAGLLSPSDFDVPFPGIDQPPLNSEDVVIPADLANMDSSEKDLLVDCDHPELPHIIAGLRDAFSCAWKDSSLFNNSSTSSSHMKTYLELSVLLNLSYSLNSMYYLLLKADRVGVTSHPVTSVLLLLQKLLGRFKAVERQGSLADRKWEQWPSIPMLRGGERACNERDEDALSFYHRVAAQKKKKTESGSRLKAAIPEDLQPLEGKRAISYQISRNKGLGVSGKRQLRNPRVKHRLKYKKALLKRKSQSLPVAREMSKYAGEVTGIKALLSRSTVIAS